MDIDWSNDRPQFRLQTLFIATTLIAVGIGLVRLWDTSFFLGLVGVSILCFCGGAICMLIGDLHEAAGCVFHLVGVILIGAAVFWFTFAAVIGFGALFFFNPF